MSDGADPRYTATPGLERPDDSAVLGAGNGTACRRRARAARADEERTAAHAMREAVQVHAFSQLPEHKWPHGMIDCSELRAIISHAQIH